MNPLTFWCAPLVLAVTSTCTVQLPLVPPTLAGMVAPVGLPKVKVVAPTVGFQDGVSPQVVLAFGMTATCRPAGNSSVNRTPVNATSFSLVRLKVSVDWPLTGIKSGENDFVSVGG